MKLEAKVLLKDISEKDLNMILKWRNQMVIREVMFNSEIISWEQHCQWFKKIKEDKHNISKVFYYDQIPYGIININRIDYENRTCEWGFYIGANDAPKGLGTILGYTTLNYIFKELDIRKLSAQVFDYNNISVNYHEKMGFVKEGELRQHIWKQQKYRNILLYGLFATEWNKHSLIVKESIERSSK